MSSSPKELTQRGGSSAVEEAPRHISALMECLQASRIKLGAVKRLSVIVCSYQTGDGEIMIVLLPRRNLQSFESSPMLNFRIHSDDFLDEVYWYRRQRHDNHTLVLSRYSHARREIYVREMYNVTVKRSLLKPNINRSVGVSYKITTFLEIHLFALAYVECRV